MRTTAQVKAHPETASPLQNINLQSTPRRIPNNVIAISDRNNFICLSSLSWAIEGQSRTINNRRLIPSDTESALKLVPGRPLIECRVFNIRVANTEHLDLAST